MLASCTAADISYTLSNDNTIKINYALALQGDQEGGEDLSGYAGTIKTYWDNLGFDTDLKHTDKEFALTGEKTIGCESGQQAAQEFGALFTTRTPSFMMLRLNMFLPITRTNTVFPPAFLWRT